jgi:CRISPR-associated protein Csd2
MTATTTLPTDVAHRYDFLFLFDVQDGNPNGDPDAANQPRIDPETGLGIVTDVCLKRKIRNFAALTRGAEPGFDIYVKERAILENLQKQVYVDLQLATASEKEVAKKASKAKDEPGSQAKAGEAAVSKARAEMCKRFFDVRAFGAVMSLKEANCGQVRGPVQMTFARSVDVVLPLEHSITRVAVATQREADNQDGDNRTMGRKNTIPYGLYLARGFFSPALAVQTGLASADLGVLWQALTNLFEHDRSAARGMMASRRLVVFEHESPLGSAPAHRLFECFEGRDADGRRFIRRRDETRPAREYHDYIVPGTDEVVARVAMVSKGVTVHDLI